jgi:hypothetical protein
MSVSSPFIHRPIATSLLGVAVKRLQAVLSLYQALGGGWLPPGVAAGVNVVQ